MRLSKLLYKSVFWRSMNILSLFILNLFISRYFGADYFGEFFYIINFFSFFILAFSLCLEAGLGFYVAKNEVNNSHAALFSIFWSLISSLFIIIILFSFKKTFLNIDQNILRIAFYYLAGTFLITFFNALFNAKHYYILPNIITIVLNISLCFFPLLHSSHKPLFQNYFFVSVFLQGVLMAISYLIIFKATLPLQAFNKFVLLKVLKYSSMSFVANIIFFLVYRVDYWFLNYFSIDAIAFGNYVQVSKLVQMFLIIPSIIATTVFSVTAKGDENLVIKNIPQLSRIIFFSVIVICTILAIVGKWLFPFIFGITFTQMYIPFLLYIPGIAAIATLYSFAAIYSGSNRITTNIIGSLLALIIIVVGNIIFIPIAGINAAAAVSSSGYVLYEVYVLIQFKKEYGLNLRDCFVLKKTDLKHIVQLLKN